MPIIFSRKNDQSNVLGCFLLIFSLAIFTTRLRVNRLLVFARRDPLIPFPFFFSSWARSAESFIKAKPAKSFFFLSFFTCYFNIKLCCFFNQLNWKNKNKTPQFLFLAKSSTPKFTFFKQNFCGDQNRQEVLTANSTRHPKFFALLGRIEAL